MDTISPTKEVRANTSPTNSPNVKAEDTHRKAMDSISPTSEIGTKAASPPTSSPPMAPPIFKADKQMRKLNISPPTDSHVEKQREEWRQRIEEWYPRWRERTYFVPPVYMYRTHHTTVQVSGQDVKVPLPAETRAVKKGDAAVMESEVNEDETQQRVLHCLHKMAVVHEEVMFVMSQLRYEDYLNEACFSAAAKSLPRPINLKKDDKHRGDFDILIIHRHFGLLVCEIKSIGAFFTSQPFTDEQKVEQTRKKAQLGVRQLNKSGDVLDHLCSDLPSPPRVHKTLVLPNVSGKHLRLVLTSCPQLEKDLRKCLGLNGVGDVVDLCVTSDQLSSVTAPYDVTNDVINRLRQWWEALVTVKGDDPAMSESVYLELLSRFCGPATTVRVFCSVKPRLNLDVTRTEGEGASETGARFTQIMLTPDQVDILNRGEARVFLCGPPGTGKTIMLLLRGLSWLRLGLHVDVISMWNKSLAASLSLVNQLEHTIGEAGVHQIHFQSLDLIGDLDVVVAKLVEAANSRGQDPCVLMDEVGGELIRSLCDKLALACPGYQLWCASLQHGKRPQCTKEEKLGQPLRSPPSITREVEKSGLLKGGGTAVYPFTSPPFPLHGDGPSYTCVYHAGPSHTAPVPMDCLQCGLDLAKLLTEDLHVGTVVPGRSSLTAAAPTLHYKDVFVLSHAHLKKDSGLVTGLTQGGVPLMVMREGDASDAADVATMTSDVVAVAKYDQVLGLERKVVAWVQRVGLAEGKKPGMHENLGRLNGVSRSTALLIWVVPH